MSRSGTESQAEVVCFRVGSNTGSSRRHGVRPPQPPGVRATSKRVVALAQGTTSTSLAIARASARREMRISANREEIRVLGRAPAPGSESDSAGPLGDRRESDDRQAARGRTQSCRRRTRVHANVHANAELGAGRHNGWTGRTTPGVPRLATSMCPEWRRARLAFMSARERCAGAAS